MSRKSPSIISCTAERCPGQKISGLGKHWHFILDCHGSESFHSPAFASRKTGERVAADWPLTLGLRQAASVKELHERLVELLCEPKNLPPVADDDGDYVRQPPTAPGIPGVNEPFPFGSIEDLLKSLAGEDHVLEGSYLGIGSLGLLKACCVTCDHGLLILFRNSVPVMKKESKTGRFTLAQAQLFFSEAVGAEHLSVSDAAEFGKVLPEFFSPPTEAKDLSKTGVPWSKRPPSA